MGWGSYLDPFTKKYFGFKCYRIGNYKVWAGSKEEALQIIRNTKKRDPYFQLDVWSPIVTRKHREGISITAYPRCVHKKNIDFKNYGESLDYLTDLVKPLFKPHKKKKKKRNKIRLL